MTTQARQWAQAGFDAGFLFGVRWWTVAFALHFSVIVVTQQPPVGATGVYLAAIAACLYLPLDHRRRRLRWLVQGLIGGALLMRTSRLALLIIDSYAGPPAPVPPPTLAALSGNLLLVLLVLRLFASDNRMLGEAELTIESTPNGR